MKSVLLFRRMPFLRLLIPLLAGVCVGNYSPLCEFWGYCALLLGVLMVLWRFTAVDLRSYRFRWVFGALLFALLLALGAYRTQTERSSLGDLTAGDGSLLMAELQEDPLAKAKSYAVEAWVVDSAMTKGGYRLMLYVAKDSLADDLSRGDRILFPNNLFHKRFLNPGEFDYEAYLRLKGVSGTCYLPGGKWRRVGHEKSFSLRGAAQEVQRGLLEKLSRYGLQGEEMAVVSAMVLGNRDYMEADLRSSYSATGASHILAVSGLHVGVVFLVMNFLLKLLFRSRYRLLRIVVLVLALWAYAFVTGLPASVVRASFMLSLVCLGKMVGRTSSVFNTVSASAFFMLLYNPFYLFDVGFQLSYAAVFSILVFQSKIKSFYVPKSKWGDWAWSLLSVSLSAQLGTLPIVLFNFHQFANYFWLSGMWVVPLSAVVIYMALLFFALPEVGLLCEWVAKLLSGVAWLMNAGVHGLEQMPFALVDGIRFGGVEVLCAYCVVVSLAMFLYRNDGRWARTLLGSLIVAFLAWGVNGYCLASQEGVAVYNIRGVSAVNRYGVGRNELSCEGDGTRVCDVVSPFWVSHNYPSSATLVEEPLFSLGEKRLYCLRDTSLRGKEARQPLQVDVVVLGKDAISSLSELQALFSFRQLVLDSSNSWRVRRRFRRECEAVGLACHDVVADGAWVMSW